MTWTRVAVALLVLSVTAPAAGARPLDVRPIPGVRALATSSDVGVARFDAAGDGVLAFTDGRSVMRVTSRPAGGRWSRPRRLGPAPDDVALDVAIASDGSAVVAWTRNDHSDPAEPYDREEDCCNRVLAAVIRPDGRPAARTRTLSPRGVSVYEPLVAARPGRYAVAWTDDRRLRVAGRDGRFGRPRRSLRGTDQIQGIRFERGRLAVTGVRPRIRSSARSSLRLVQRLGGGPTRVVSARLPFSDELSYDVRSAGGGTVVLFGADYDRSDTPIAIQRRFATRFVRRRVPGTELYFGDPRGPRLPLLLGDTRARRRVRYAILRPGDSTGLGRTASVRVRRPGPPGTVGSAALTLTRDGRVAGLQFRRRDGRMRVALVREGARPRDLGAFRASRRRDASASALGVTASRAGRLTAVLASTARLTRTVSACLPGTC